MFSVSRSVRHNLGIWLLVLTVTAGVALKWACLLALTVLRWLAGSAGLAVAVSLALLGVFGYWVIDQGLRLLRRLVDRHFDAIFEDWM